VDQPWLPDGWAHPISVPLNETHHLRPIRATDVDLDMPAVMGSQARLFSIFGPAWGWPPPDMTAEQDRADLERHEREADAHESFNYAIFDGGETVLIGCIYVDPPEKQGADADISWWVRDEYVATELESTLDAFVPAWIADEWPFTTPRFIGRDLSWAEWLALPDA
jgi:hypothetical protein